MWLIVGTVAEASAAVHLAATHIIRRKKVEVEVTEEDVALLLPAILFDLCCRAGIVTMESGLDRAHTKGGGCPPLSSSLLLRMIEDDDDTILNHWLHGI